jgi:effector-binding domain-containing protein
VDGADMTKPFTLDIGIETVDDAKPTDDLKVRKLSRFKCATMLYTGSLQNLSKVYEKLVPAALAAGHKLTGESREFYLYWEGPDSKNNVVQVQVGIE